jgi:hypothetical protein
VVVVSKCAHDKKNNINCVYEKRKGGADSKQIGTDFSGAESRKSAKEEHFHEHDTRKILCEYFIHGFKSTLATNVTIFKLVLL